MNATATDPRSRLIAANHRRWGQRATEDVIFGDARPDAIVERIDALCRTTLGASVERYRLHDASVASVHGVDLADGRSVVVKVHGPGVTPMRIAATLEVQRALAATGFPAPAPIAGPIRIARGHAVVERWLADGTTPDGHDLVYRTAIARSYAELIDRCRSVAPRFAFRCLFSRRSGLWPRPHSPLFDFERTRRGAGWIDRAARRALDELGEVTDAGRTVVSHGDWRAGNLRFDRRRRRIAAAYDWVSLARAREPVHIGSTAHAFCVDWDRDASPAPTLEEIRTFVAEYEDARGASFSAREHRALAASLTYAVAYTARCEHAADTNGTASSSYRRLLEAHGRELLAPT